MDAKNHLTEFLELKERAEEDQYFAARDRELIAKLKQAHEGEHESTLCELARFRCPQCGKRLRSRSFHGVTIDVCPACQGAWLGKEKLATVMQGKGRRWVKRFLAGLSQLVEHPYGCYIGLIRMLSSQAQASAWLDAKGGGEPRRTGLGGVGAGQRRSLLLYPLSSRVLSSMCEVAPLCCRAQQPARLPRFVTSPVASLTGLQTHRLTVLHAVQHRACPQAQQSYQRQAHWMNAD